MIDRRLNEPLRSAEHCLKEKRLADALRLFDEAARFTGKDPRPWRGKGIVLEKM